MHPLSGVYAATVTPLLSTGAPDLEAIPPFLAFLAQRGCHGALLLGSTGEGPSFSTAERLAIFKAAAQVRQAYPEFRLIAGTGSANLTDTLEMTRGAYDLGFEATLVLPPFYFRKVSDEGLLAYYRQVAAQAVPGDGWLLAYHFPGLIGVPLSLELLTRLKEGLPGQFMGIKDSSDDLSLTRALGERFGHDFVVLNGKDELLAEALLHQSSGAITALANLLSPDLRRVWEAHAGGRRDLPAEARLGAARLVWERYPPAAAFIKGLLARRHGFTEWSVRLPLLPLDESQMAAATAEFAAAVEES